MPLTHTIINKLTPSEKCTPSRPDKLTSAVKSVDINLGDFNQ